MSATKSGAGMIDADTGPVPQPMLFLVLEASRPLAMAGRWRLDGLTEVIIGHGPRATKHSSMRKRILITVPDEHLSRLHARMRLDDGKWVIHDTRSKRGVIVNGQRLVSALLKDGDLIELGRTFLLFRTKHAVTASDVRAATVGELAPGAPELQTMVPELLRTFAAVRAAVEAGRHIMVVGDAGTGKRSIARALHASSRRRGELITFDGDPERLREALGGVLFIDKIDEVPAPAQRALLHMVASGAADVLVMGTTRRPLDDLGANLLVRLDAHRVTVPPLRERREDLGVLIGWLLRALAPANAWKYYLSPEAARALLRHDYQRNLHELRAILAAGIAEARDGCIDIAHLLHDVGAEAGDALDV